MVLGTQGWKKSHSLALSRGCEIQWLWTFYSRPSVPMTVLATLKSRMESSSYQYTQGLNWNPDDTR